MKYSRPRLFNSNRFGLADAACMDGSNPAYGVCVCAVGGNPASQGAACQGGCTARNKCTNGSDAGFLGKPQGCYSGTAAKVNTDPPDYGCGAGSGVSETFSGGGCINGYSAFGCITGNNRFIACNAGTTDS